MAQAILSVPDISCEHCERTVKNALTPVKGVQSVAVNIPAKEVQVTYDAALVGIDAMKEVLAAEDYPVAAVSAG
ncbi:MAG TPA: heavy-metal-associated domain-containing protein [Chloroflexota bacterium]|nr:heavy-metal-associated domain-containing protein [Chloroflexota bacterium]